MEINGNTGSLEIDTKYRAHPTIGEYSIQCKDGKLLVISGPPVRFNVVDVEVGRECITFATGIDMGCDEANDRADLVLHAIGGVLEIIGVEFDFFNQRSAKIIGDRVTIKTNYKG